MTQWLAILTPIFGVVAAIASALAGITYSVTRTLRDSNIDLRARVKDLETDRERDKAENAELHGENKLLRQIATGEIDWHAVTDLLGAHHEEANQHWTNTEALLNEILDVLRGAES